MYLEGIKVSWLQLMILPDVRPKNFMGQKHCVTIYSYTTPQCLILEKVFFFQVTAEVHLPLLFLRGCVRDDDNTEFSSFCFQLPGGGV